MKSYIRRYKGCFGAFSLDGLAPLDKRRLSRAAKHIYTAFLDAFNENEIDPKSTIIFATNLGEIKHCINLMSELNSDHLISPNGFANSVLNAAIANIAILKQFHGEIIAISSTDPINAALISAKARLITQTKNIVIVIYEEDFYSQKSGCVVCELAAANEAKIDNNNDLLSPSPLCKLNIDKSLDGVTQIDDFVKWLKNADI